MKEITPKVLTYTGKSASFNTDFMDLSAFEEAHIFIRVDTRTNDRTVAIGNIQVTPPLESGLPADTTNVLNLDVTKYTIEGAYPAAIGVAGALAHMTLLKPCMWTRFALTIGGTTGTIDFTVTILGKD